MKNQSQSRYCQIFTYNLYFILVNLHFRFASELHLIDANLVIQTTFSLSIEMLLTLWLLNPWLVEEEDLANMEYVPWEVNLAIVMYPPDLGNLMLPFLVM